MKPTYDSILLTIRSYRYCRIHITNILICLAQELLPNFRHKKKVGTLPTYMEISLHMDFPAMHTF